MPPDAVGGGRGSRVDLERYHASRSIEHQPFRAACYAPFVGLSFDVHGTVSVCAFTRTTPLGWIGDRPLQEMWDGAVAESLRTAVLGDDLDTYCSRCAEEVAGGNLHGALARGFDEFTVPAGRPWPRRMEFALSNTCNLQCVMCSGEFSSAIRARREGLPPLRSPYDDDFLEQLDPFLPHLAQARFLGGEPLLAEVNHRIWERLVAVGASTQVNLTTNGTVWNRRVEALLESLPWSVGISVDGATAATVESIRAGASHERILEVLGHFLAARERTGGSVSLTYCLMVENWHEFADFLEFAEERGCQVYVNTVRQPPRHSLYHLPADDLATVVAELEAREHAVARRLTINRDAWCEQVGRLRAALEDRRRSERSADGAPGGLGGYQRLVEAVVADASEAAVLAALAPVAEDEPSILRCDDAGTIVDAGDYVGVDVTHLVGSSSRRVLPFLAERLGNRTDVVAEASARGIQARVVEFSASHLAPTYVALVASGGTGGGFGSTRIAARLRRPEPAGGVPVPAPSRRRD